jgi:acetate kinase
MRVLVVNAGSSSLKLRLLDGADALVGNVDLALDGELSEPAVRDALDGLGTADAVGHRVVHGGRAHTAPVIVDDRVMAELRQLTDLAPLHQPAALDALDVVRRCRPELPAVACFDTAFHAGLPAAASTYALPRRWRDPLDVRRYGFHGLSHAYAARRAAELLGRPVTGLRVVTCHLGAGASLAAVRDGRSIDTTMGFTPLDGLVMATRSGALDPGLVLWLEQHAGIPAAELEHELEHGSGLLGLAGTSDMRQVVARAAAGEPDATLALDVYLHRLRALIAGMAAALDGLDALVFTGGVGEGSPAVRSGAANGLGFLGVRIDAGRNGSAGGDGDISRDGAAVATLVVRAREDLEIARGVREALA